MFVFIAILSKTVRHYVLFTKTVRHSAIYEKQNINISDTIKEKKSTEPDHFSK